MDTSPDTQYDTIVDNIVDKLATTIHSMDASELELLFSKLTVKFANDSAEATKLDQPYASMVNHNISQGMNTTAHWISKSRLGEHVK
jgi:hypothetical protein